MILLIVLPMAYFLSAGTSHYYYKKGNALIKLAQLKEADAALSIAELLWSSYDLPPYLRASIYQVTIPASPHLGAAMRKQLFRESEKRLERAWGLNLWRPEVFIVYGRLYRQNRDLAGQDWHEKAAQSYRHALAIDPRCYEARIDYAGMLLEGGDGRPAAEILKAGMEHWYPGDYRILPYYRLTAVICRRVGDSVTAEKADRLIAAIVSTLKRPAAATLERAF